MPCVLRTAFSPYLVPPLRAGGGATSGGEERRRGFTARLLRLSIVESDASPSLAVPIGKVGRTKVSHGRVKIHGGGFYTNLRRTLRANTVHACRPCHTYKIFVHTAHPDNILCPICLKSIYIVCPAAGGVRLKNFS